MPSDWISDISSFQTGTRRSPYKMFDKSIKINEYIKLLPISSVHRQLKAESFSFLPQRALNSFWACVKFAFDSSECWLLSVCFSSKFMNLDNFELADRILQGNFFYWSMCCQFMILQMVQLILNELGQCLHLKDFIPLRRRDNLLLEYRNLM